MSYILDALRKAERERGIAQVPNLMTVHDFRSTPRHRTWFLTGLLVLCAAALVWYFLPALKTIARHPTSAGENRVAQQLPAAAAVNYSDLRAIVPSGNLKNESALTETIAAGKTKPERAMVASNAGPKRSGSEQRPVPSTPAQPVPQQNSPKPAALSAATTTPALQPPAAPARSAAAEQNPVPPASPATPASLSEAMAMMNLSILLYSDTPAERMVFINGRKYVEGDHIDGKYLIESITLEGAVLSYQGDQGVLRPRRK